MNGKRVTDLAGRSGMSLCTKEVGFALCVADDVEV